MEDTNKMSIQDRMEYLLQYHENLISQLEIRKNGNYVRKESLNSSIALVEGEIEKILSL